MRSFEDKWMWLRSQLKDDAATLLDRSNAATDGRQRADRLNKLAGVLVALQHMDQADRNGPVETLNTEAGA